MGRNCLYKRNIGEFGLEGYYMDLVIRGTRIIRMGRIKGMFANCETALRMSLATKANKTLRFVTPVPRFLN